MELLSNPWLVALFTLFIGIGLGVYIHRAKYSDDSQSEKLKDELQTLEEDFDQYKSSVADHFDKTSELVQGLTENYIKVYQHLAEGSQSLANTDQMNLRLDQGEQDLAAVINKIEDASSNTAADADMQAPRDYAPKPADKESEGTLSEAFSIKKDQPQQAPEELVDPGEPEQKRA